MKKILSLIFIFVFLEVVGREVDLYSKQVDKFNAVYNIDGILLEQNQITTLKNGQLSGPMLYTINRDSDNVCYIATLLFYQNNILHGSSIDFYSNGVIKTLVTNILPNTNYPELKNTFPFQSYCYEFYDTGKIKAEGWGLIEEDIMIGESVRIGIWKYYDHNGDVKEVEYPREFTDSSDRLIF